MIVYLRLSFLCLLSFLFGSNISSQHFYFRNLTDQEGVPSSCVYRVFEDSKGYVWYVTDKGIARYDGNKCKYFTPSDGFEEAGAFHITEAHDSSLWFLANYLIYGFKKERFFQVPFSERFAWIDVDPEGNTWLLSVEGDIYRLDTRTNQIIPYWIFKNDPRSAAYSLLHLPNGKFLMGTASGTFEVAKNSRRKLLTSDVYRSYIPARFFRFADSILISNESAGYVTDYHLKTLRPIQHLRGTMSLYNDAVTGDVWIGSWQGMWRFPEGQIREDHAQQFLTDHVVTCIQKCRDNNYWLATADAGIFCCNFQSQHLDQQEGLPEKGLLHVKKENHRIYGFALGKEFYELGKHHVYAHRYPSDMPLIIEAIGANDTAMYLGGSEFLQLRDGKIKEVKKSFVCFKSTYRGPFLMCTPMGAVYVPGVNDTLISATIFWQISNLYIRLKDIPFKSHPIFMDKEVAYYAYPSGIIEFPWQKKPVHIKKTPLKGHISDIDKCFETIVISTYNNGIFLKNGNAITHVDVINGLSSNYCKKIYVRGDQIWLATNKGISKVRLSADGTIRQITHITSKDYLLKDEVNSLEFENGMVYAATGKGVSIFPENVQQTKYKPSILIEKIQINNTDTTLLSEYTLSYDQNNILIQFNSPDVRSGNYNLYQGIIVKGRDIDTHYYANNTLQLGSLMPGDYKLMMNVRNIDGLWSSIPSIVHIIIRPPFWKTWWFLLALACVCGGIISYAIFNRIRSLRKGAEFSLKLIQSDLRSLRLHMNPHFIFNSLTSLQSYILTNKTDEADDYITRFSTLIRAIMNYSVKGEIRLDDEIDLLKQYMELEMIRFENQFGYTIQLDPDISAQEIIIPSLLIQPFVENAIKHGLTGLNRKGELIIHFSRIKEGLQCTILDNGRGRTQAAQHRTKHKDHQSSGVSFTVERIRLLIPDSQHPIIDIQDLVENDKPSGTKVIVLIPILNEIPL